jgi:cyclophilin family peptidyl-prolyl cis-trans isomerase
VGRRLFRVVPLLAALALAVTGCGDDDSPTDDGASGGGGGGQQASGGCERAQAPKPRKAETESAPTERLDPQQAYEITFDTSCGPFTVRLDVRQSPKATASIAALVDNGYYDDTLIHRIVPGFVVQGGDPSASGSGGPGYRTVDPPPSGATYAPGVVAMAKTAADPPGAAGSQFFVVTGDAQLPPEYAIVGEVVEGMDVVSLIEGTGETGPSTDPVVIESASLQVS